MYQNLSYLIHLPEVIKHSLLNLLCGRIILKSISPADSMNFTKIKYSFIPINSVKNSSQAGQKSKHIKGRFTSKEKCFGWKKINTQKGFIKAKEQNLIWYPKNSGNASEVSLSASE